VATSLAPSASSSGASAAGSARAPRDQAPSEPQLGAYRVLGSLGRGGTAQVFKAEHQRLGQIRALKVLLPEISARPDLVGRLLTEARAMARLRHPAIVEVLDCDVLPDGTAFIAMEYLRGEPLRSWLERVGRLHQHPELAAAIVGVVAQGLLFAHEHGVVHRDLKPENILLVASAGEGPAFSLKILDFGIAKLLSEEPLTRTRVGCVVGTPMYMAPEQWRPGEEIDCRTDIYALGCLLFELLTGRPPFNAHDDMSMRRAHLELAPPTLESLVPGLPQGFDPLVARMLAKDPAERPHGVEEVLVELEKLAGQPRDQFAGLLRAPEGRAVVPKQTVACEPLVWPRWTGVSPPSGPGSPSGVLPFATDAWRGRVPARKRLALLACLGALGATAVVGGILLATKESPPAAAAAATGGTPETEPAPAPPPREPGAGRLRPSAAAPTSRAPGPRPEPERSSLTATEPPVQPEVRRARASRPAGAPAPDRPVRARPASRGSNRYQKVGD
jgi:eukaryotic-like serine/threonine-protein kinase